MRGIKMEMPSLPFKKLHSSKIPALTSCCKSETQVRWFDVVRCCKCGQEDSCSFEEIELNVSNYGTEIIVDEGGKMEEAEELSL